MCDITGGALTLGALSVGSTAAAYYGQAANAAAQAKYQNEMYAQTAKIAKENYVQQIGSATLRTEQEAAATGQVAQQNVVAAMQAQSTALVAAGEAGIEGNSVDAMYDEFARQEAVNNAVLSTNLRWKTDQIEQEKLAMQAEAKSRIAGATPGPVNMPSALGAALQIGTGLFGAYDYNNRLLGRGAYAPTGTATRQNSFWTSPIFGK